MKKLIGLLSCILIICLISGCSGEPKYTAATTQTFEGSTLLLEKLVLKIEGQEQREEVKPQSPMGYYDYYKHFDGYYYHVVYGTIKNTGSEQFYTKSLSIEAVGENETYESKIVLIPTIPIAFWEDMAPNEEIGYYVFSIVPEDKPAPTEYRFYYNHEFKEGEEYTFDFCTVLLLS